MSDDRRSSARFRYASQMAQRLQHQENRTTEQINHVMARLREVTGANLPGSPVSSVASEPESPFVDKEQCDSPTTQLQQQIGRSLESQFRSQQRLSKALLQVISLDSAFRQVEEPRHPPALGAAAASKADCSPGDVGKDRLQDTEVWPGAREAIIEGKDMKADCSHSWRRTSAQQPEEEAEAPSLPDAVAAQRLAGKAACDESHDRAEADTSRQSQSTCLTDEPAREPQPKESPRGEEESTRLPSIFQELLAQEPDDEPTAAAAEELTIPSQSGNLDGVPVEADASAIDSSSETDTGGTEVAEPTEDSFEVCSHPRAGEEGMPRVETYLHQLEQSELHKQIMVIVPEGMAENRLVTFVYENKKHDVRIPEGYAVGQEVAIFVPKKPPLERSAAQAMCRGHHGFPDRYAIIEPLKHSSRSRSPCSLDDPEFRYRHELYRHLRGTSMSPLLPYTPEEFEPEEESDGDHHAAQVA